MAWTERGVLAGLQGDPGVDGDDGAPGVDGDDGARGSKWYAAAGLPGSANGIAATVGSAAGDFYLDTDTGTFYELT